MQNFRKIAKFRCCEICKPQNREINMSQKFHVIRYLSSYSVTKTDLQKDIKLLVVKNYQFSNLFLSF